MKREKRNRFPVFFVVSSVSSGFLFPVFHEKTSDNSSNNTALTTRHRGPQLRIGEWDKQSIPGRPNHHIPLMFAVDAGFRVPPRHIIIISTDGCWLYTHCSVCQIRYTYTVQSSTSLLLVVLYFYGTSTTNCIYLLVQYECCFYAYETVVVVYYIIVAAAVPGTGTSYTLLCCDTSVMQQ